MFAVVLEFSLVESAHCDARFDTLGVFIFGQLCLIAGLGAQIASLVGLCELHLLIDHESVPMEHLVAAHAEIFSVVGLVDFADPLHHFLQ